MTPKLLLWDIDGTLIRGKGAGRRAMSRSFEDVFGIPDAFMKIEMHGRIDLDFIAEVFELHKIDKEKLPEFLDGYYRALQEEARADNTDLIPGVVEALTRLEDIPDFYNALGTGNVEVGARIKLDVYDLNQYFPVGGFCERPEERFEVLQNGVEQAKAFYGIEFAVSDVIVIGDTVRDVEAARKIGARIVSVATGGNTYDELQEVDPDLLLEDLWEFDRLLEMFGGPSEDF